MARQPKYKLEQPRNSSDNPFDVTNLTAIPRNHHIYKNNHEQLYADPTFRPIKNNSKAAREKRQSYELPQQQSSIIPNINRPHINGDSTNEMVRKEKNRRLENNRQDQSSKCCRCHRCSGCDCCRRCWRSDAWIEALIDYCCSICCDCVEGVFDSTD